MRIRTKTTSRTWLWLRLHTVPTCAHLGSEVLRGGGGNTAFESEKHRKNLVKGNRRGNLW